MVSSSPCLIPIFSKSLLLIKLSLHSSTNVFFFDYSST
jgi:hypothetical protein